MIKAQIQHPAPDFTADAALPVGMSMCMREVLSLFSQKEVRMNTRLLGTIGMLASFKLRI